MTERPERAESVSRGRFDLDPDVGQHRANDGHNSLDVLGTGGGNGSPGSSVHISVTSCSAFVTRSAMPEREQQSIPPSAFNVLRSYLEARGAFSDDELDLVRAAFLFRRLPAGEFLQRAGA